MARILVAGHVNIETTLRVDGFPLDYFPVTYPFFGINSTVAGVGFNIAKALHTLGDEARLLTLVGRDLAGAQVRDAVAALGLDPATVRAAVDQTAQSVILYDPGGRRQIHTDLKDIQEQTYPAAAFRAAAADADLLVLCNINYTRAFLSLGKELGKPVATDVHAIADLDDAYNRDFMAHADILFMSHERLPVPPDAWARRSWPAMHSAVLVIGLGADGALLAQRVCAGRGPRARGDHTPGGEHGGRGDSLFAALVHAYAAHGDPLAALQPPSSLPGTRSASPARRPASSPGASWRSVTALWPPR
ncbi:MAG: carbohydrate kinase family protein [Caldilineaceae bacterium]